MGVTDVKRNHIYPLVILTALAIALGACSGSAKDYHVSTTGDDGSAGSKARPFKTISAAAKVARPGDVVTVHEGIYRERVNPPRGGTSDKTRIVYQAAAGEKVVITGSEIIKGRSIEASCPTFTRTTRTRRQPSPATARGCSSHTRRPPR